MELLEQQGHEACTQMIMICCTIYTELNLSFQLIEAIERWIINQSINSGIFQQYRHLSWNYIKQCIQLGVHIILIRRPPLLILGFLYFFIIFCILMLYVFRFFLILSTKNLTFPPHLCVALLHKHKHRGCYCNDMFCVETCSAQY